MRADMNGALREVWMPKNVDGGADGFLPSIFPDLI